jgi:autotransporter-associated beta strand protein
MLRALFLASSKSMRFVRVMLLLKLARTEQLSGWDRGGRFTPCLPVSGHTAIRIPHGLASWLGLLLLAGVAAPGAAHAQTPAFPGALGFGANATGGRGGNVYHVTNLNDSGAGSFRDAVGTAGRTVVFDVGGYITLNSEAAVKSNITIAGQTAPGGGIAIRGAEVTFGNQSNVICRFVRFRPGGDSNQTDNGLSLYQAKNVILDHISIEFAKWNNIDAVSEDWQNKPVNNITVQNSIIANPIYQQFGAHTECVGGTWSWFNNIFASGHNRQPLAKINTVFINNTVYNYSAAYTTHTSTAFKHDILNNYFIGGPASAGTDNTWFQIDKNQSIYYSGNYKDRDRDTTLNGSITTPYWYQGTGTVLAAPWSSVTTDLLASANPPLSAAQAVVRNNCDAGVLPRDEIDALVLSQVKTLGNGPTGTGAGTAGPGGGLYTSQTSTGLSDNGYGTIASGTPPVDSDRDGMPDDWEAAKGLNAANAADGKIIQASGYSNLEDYLNWLALPHAFVAKNTAALPTSVTIDLSPFAGGFPNGVTFTLSGVSGGTVTQAGAGGYNVTFTPTANTSGLGGFTFSVTNGGYTWSRAVGVLISPNPLPKTMLWKGDGVTNAWNTAAANWTDTSTGTAAVFSNGDRVTLDDTGSATPALALSGTLAPSYVQKISDLKNYTLGGSGTLNGGMALVIDGAGSLTLANGANSYSGGTFIQDSTLILSGSATPGIGAITLQGSSMLTSNYAAGTLLNLGANSLKVDDGDSATINLSARTALGACEGAGIVNLLVKGTAPDTAGNYLTGSWSGFSGTLHVTGAVANAQLGLNINGGGFDHFGAATVNLDAIKIQSRHNSGGNTIAIGALNGTSTAWLAGSSYAGGATYSIGGKNTACVFSGTISDGVAPSIVTKTGSSTLNLRGPHTYTGATNVTAGTLYATGVFAGVLNINGGSLSPGDPTSNVVGQIQANGGFTLSNGSLSLDLSSSPNGANDRVTVPTGMTTTLGGANTFRLKFTDGFLSAGTYKLIDGNSSLTVVSGMTMSFTSPLPANSRQTFSLVRNSTGTPVPAYVNLVVAGDAANLTWTGANGGAWDLGTTGAWTSSAATNSNLFFNFDSVNFTDATGAGAVTITGSVVPRLVNCSANTTGFTFAGTGTIDGVASLNKTGSGTLTIGGSGVHTFTGGTTLQSGTLLLDTAVATPLGTGQVFVNGGTLHLGIARSLPNSTVFSGTSTVASTSGNVNLVGNPANTMSGPNSAVVNFSIPSSLCTIQGPMSGFAGSIHMGASAGTLRLNGSTNANYGSATAAFDLGTGSATFCNRNGDITLELGAVSGGANTTLQGRQSGSGDTTSNYVIGGRNTDAVFAGHIVSGGDLSGLNIIKVGSGNWTLSGTSNFTGDMTIQAGRLTLTGALTHVGECAVLSSAALHLGGGQLTTEAITIGPGAQLTGTGTVMGDLVNYGTVNCNGALNITGGVTNHGILRLTGGAALSVSGTFVNHGTLDLLTGAQTLPANFVNNGIVLDSSLVRATAASRIGTSVTVTIQGFPGHSYRLQRSTSLGDPDWTSIGEAQTPSFNNQTLAFTDSSATGMQGFYRIVVAP